MSKPAKNLSPTRPTARLLGYETVISVTGQIFISVVFMIIAIITLFQQPWFLCHEFEGFKADMRKWWELADSYESEVNERVFLKLNHVRFLDCWRAFKLYLRPLLLILDLL